MNRTAAYMEPMALKRSTEFSLQELDGRSRMPIVNYLFVIDRLSGYENTNRPSREAAYVFLPSFQKMVPKMRAMMVVKKILVAV